MRADGIGFGGGFPYMGLVKFRKRAGMSGACTTPTLLSFCR
jgi:hypothetical protein